MFLHLLEESGEDAGRRRQVVILLQKQRRVSGSDVGDRRRQRSFEFRRRRQRERFVTDAAESDIAGTTRRLKVRR